MTQQSTAQKKTQARVDGKNRLMEPIRLSMTLNKERQIILDFQSEVKTFREKMKTAFLATLHTLDQTVEKAHDGVTQITSFWTHSFPMPGTNQRLTMALVFTCSKVSIGNLTENN